MHSAVGLVPFIVSHQYEGGLHVDQMCRSGTQMGLSFRFMQIYKDNLQIYKSRSKKSYRRMITSSRSRGYVAPGSGHDSSNICGTYY